MKAPQGSWVVTPLPVFLGVILTYVLSAVLFAVFQTINTGTPPNLLEWLAIFLIGGLWVILPFAAIGILVTCTIQVLLKHVKSHMVHAAAMGLAVFLVGIVILSLGSQQFSWDYITFIGPIAISTMIARLLVSRFIKSEVQPTTERVPRLAHRRH